MENTVNADNNQTPLEATLAAHRTKWTEDIKEINEICCFQKTIVL